MKSLRLAAIALLLGAVTTTAVYAQSSGYPTRPAPPPDYGQGDYGRDHDDYGRGYDDYGRGYDDRYSPRGDVGFFYDELSPYGDWVRTRDYGWAWFPRDVHPYWRPYSDGRWVVTEYGWTWVSYEPFGWATYHYGRWAWDPRFGWLWVPGTIWGPAWVSWQHGGGYVGWAPLPPSVGFEVGFGIRLGGFNLSLGIRPDAYSFVRERSFLEPRISGYVVPTARNITIIHNTTNITNYTYVDNRVVNRGVDVGRIEQATGRRLQRLRVAEANDKHRSEVKANEVRIYRPERKKLDAVRVGPRANAGKRADVPPERQVQSRPPAERRDAPEIEVAPRPTQVPRTDARQLEQKERREHQELERFQAEEQRKIEKLHQQEIAQARAQAERAQVEKRHQAERAELQQEQRNAAQQLEARQRAKRQAALANPPGRAIPQGEKKADDDQLDDKDKKDGKGKKVTGTSPQVQGHGPDGKPVPPPPA